MDFGDWDDIGKILTYLIPAIIIILTNVVFRKQKQQKETSRNSLTYTTSASDAPDAKAHANRDYPYIASSSKPLRRR